MDGRCYTCVPVLKISKWPNTTYNSTRKECQNKAVHTIQIARPNGSTRKIKRGSRVCIMLCLLAGWIWSNYFKKMEQIFIKSTQRV